MPTRKSQPSTGSKAKKSQRVSSKNLLGGGPLPPYGVAIRNAMARGEKREMLQVAAATRKWMREVQTALNAMEKSLSDLEG
ncbi:MAG: hypothetical protein QOE77_1916 [Blastocatellia bacterium]|jgi:hypothetical protein|nr:hypothetical protein [Blastocatellia bacterium]